MTYTLTRYDEATDTETEFELEVDINVIPAEYEDGYQLPGTGGVEINEITRDGEPFETTKEEDDEIAEWACKRVEIPRHYYRGDF